MKPYFSPARPRVLAHRGLTLDAPENSLLAFARAIAAGSTYVETDVRASSDGVAMIHHDAELAEDVPMPSGSARTTDAPTERRIRNLTSDELASLDLGYEQAVPTLEAALRAFPGTRFNVDIKSEDAVAPTVAAILATGATDRVLVTSFSERRRRRAVRELPGVATSASARRFATALVAARLGRPAGIAWALRGLDAVQIPTRALGLSTLSPLMLDTVHALGIEVHVWTVNDPVTMSRLFDVGVDGIVTDRVDLALRVVTARFG